MLVTFIILLYHCTNCMLILSIGETEYIREQQTVG